MSRKKRRASLADESKQDGRTGSRLTPIDKTVASLRESLRGLAGSLVTCRGGLHPNASKIPQDFVFPDNVRIVFAGAHRYGVVLGSDAIDLMVVVNYDTLFSPKDDLDFGYFGKKQMLMKFLAERLGWAVVDAFDATYAFTADHLSYKVLFGVCVKEAKSWKVFRMSPGRCNVREDRSGADAPTPLYNALILRDVLAERLCEYIRDVMVSSEHAVEAMRLFKAWYRRMEFDRMSGMPGIFALGYLFAFWLKEGKLSAPSECHDSMHLFKSFISHISLHDWSAPVVCGTFSGPDLLPSEYKHAFDLASFSKHFEAVLLEHGGVLNLFYDVRLSGMQILCHYAKRLLECLNGRMAVSLEELIVGEARELMFYDFSVLVDTSVSAISLTESLGYSAKRINALSLKAVELVKEALSDRLTIVGAKPVSDTRFNIVIKVDVAKCFRLVDLGPYPQETEKVSKFRALWGSKADLRKFESGTVQWAAAWPELSNTRHLIVVEAIRHLLRLHNISDSQQFLCDQLDFMLEPEKNGPILKPFSYFHEAFEHLSGILRRDSKLPLGVVQVVPVSDMLRYTATFPSLVEPRVAGCCAPVAEALLIFERSTRWPDDLSALKCAKLAFLLQIQAILESEFKIPCSVNSAECFVDIFYKSTVFRFMIKVEKEMKLLEKEGMSEEVKAWKHLYNDRALFHAKMHSLINANVVLSSTIRLVKRWMASQLLSFLHDDLAELICGIVFTRTDLGSSPGSVVSGFYRVLGLVAKHHHSTPFVFDPEKSLDATSMADIQRDCSMAVYCSFLKHGKYDIPLPSVFEWKQLQRIAKASLLLLEDDSLHAASCLRELLSPVLVESGHLRSYSVPQGFNNAVLCSRRKRPSEAIDKIIRKAAGPMSDFMKSLPGLNLTVALAGQLGREYGLTCYYDKYDGSCVAVARDAPEMTELSQLND